MILDIAICIGLTTLAALALSSIIDLVFYVVDRLRWRRPSGGHIQLLTDHCYRALARLDAGDVSAARFTWTQRDNDTRGLHPFRFVVMELPPGADPHVRGAARVKYLAYSLGDFA